MTPAIPLSSTMQSKSFASSRAYFARSADNLNARIREIDGADRLEATLTDKSGVVQARFVAENSFRAAVVLHEVCEALTVGNAFLDSASDSLPRQWRVVRTAFLPQERQLFAASEGGTWQMLSIRSGRSPFNQWLQGFNLYAVNPELIARVEESLDAGVFFAKPVADSESRVMPWLVDATALVAAL